MRIRLTGCHAMRARIQWRKGIMLLMTLAMAGLLSGFGMTVVRLPVSSNAVLIPLHHAVFRFDTRIVFSCEEFTREMVRRPLVNMTVHVGDQWKRIKADLRRPRSSGQASPKCLVQAGLMVL